MIGEKTADRYADTAEAERRVPNRRAMIAELVEISEGIRDLSRGVRVATALHNAEAATHRLIATTKSPEAETAGCGRR